MALSLTAVGNAIRDWVVAASGLPDNKVIWANQNGPRPTGTFITLKMSGQRRVTTTDEVTQDYDAARPLAQEIEHRVHGLREFSLSIQAFTAAARGDGSATDILTGLISSLSLQTHITTLAAQSVSIFDAGDVKDLAALLDSDFESRALLECRGYLIDDRHAERSSFIESVEITATDNTDPESPVDFPFTASIDN